MASRTQRSALSPRRRRGVLLLVVLSMLVLFLLMGLTFVVVGTSYKDASESLAKIERTGDSPRKELDSAMYQLVRDTTNPLSAIRGHSLLRDMYGNDGVDGRIISAVKSVGGLFLELTIAVSTPQTQSPEFARAEGYYNGRVFSIVSGRYRAHSTRIVSYLPASGGTVTSATIRVLNSWPNAAQPPNPNNLANARFLINGRPFNGTGFGFDPETGQMGVDALLPNRIPVDFSVDPLFQNHFLTGGADESYDAPDFQNMALAAVVGHRRADNSAGRAALPSFHRPQLIAFQTGAPRASLRVPGLPPLALQTGDDYPLFKYDVDNDSDGFSESIWVDIGMSEKTAADGRRYKPLFAFYCTDLDGRLNLNAHGTSQELELQNDPAYRSPVSGQYATMYAGNGVGGNVDLPRGFGYGPAEINLDVLTMDLLDGAGAALPAILAPAELAEILRGGNFVNGRYSGHTGTVTVGRAASNELFRIKYSTLRYPHMVPSVWGKWPDVRGRGFLGLDHLGHPLLAQTAVSNNELFQLPYRLDLSRLAPRPTSAVGYGFDNPFTPGELERILRSPDADSAMLPDRFARLSSSSGVIGKLLAERHKLTTESFDLPSPSSFATANFANQYFTNPPATSGVSQYPTHHELSDMLRYYLEQTGHPDVSGQLKKMLSPELIAGLRMDVNRPLGNALDDDGDGTVDELDEVPVEMVWQSTPGPATGEVPQTVDFHGIPFGHSHGLDLDGDGMLTPVDRSLGRHLMARHLFVLMMLLYDNQFNDWTFAGGISPDAKQELTIQRIAQWAINVVDFRDEDSAMTPFEYDINPFNGWNVDGIVGTLDDGSQPDRRLVWGCEYPDLLITESLAFHDRRVEDTNREEPEAGQSIPKLYVDQTNGTDAEPDGNHQGEQTPNDDDDTNDEDDDLDQVRIPQGSLFFELYCTRGPQDNHFRGDLYSDPNAPRLDLARMAGSTPVWRVVVSGPNVEADNNLQQRLASDPETISLEPENMNMLKNAPENDMRIERIIWFTNQASTGNEYWRREGTSQLPGGHYLVVGPRENTSTGVVDGTPIQNSPQRLRFVGTGQNMTFTATELNGEAATPSTGTEIQSPHGMIVAAGSTGISISEPLPTDYYEPPNHQIPGRGIQDAYDPPLDVPLDKLENAPLSNLNDGQKTQTIENYKTLLLQRLADPTIEHHSVSNPYRTVDWIPVDLTVFNGQASQDHAGLLEQWDPDDTDCNNSDIVEFGSRQRGSKSDANPASPNHVNIWSNWSWSSQEHNSQEPRSLGSLTVPPTTPSIFDQRLGHTLGYLNTTYSSGPATLDYVSRNHLLTSGVPSQYFGSPKRPFPWLTWFNRSFTNPFELMNVPACSQARLLHEFRLDPTDNPYGGTSPSQVFRRNFSYLLNFFHSSGGAESAPPSPKFYRIFEYLRTRSPFVKTETYLPPGNPDLVGTAMVPPFNLVSEYRDPGRVNINTIYNPWTWSAILNGRLGPLFREITDSRRGDTSSLNILNPMTANVPTFFANPFRAATSGALVPAGANLDLGNEIDATLMRRSQSSGTPLFATDSSSNPEYVNQTRNPLLRFQDLQRLSNLLTTRSNVYAIWITVGYFEVDPNNPLSVVRELGSDIGEVRRHRAFYIVDRTIPVAFEPGKNHNVDEAIILRRFIE